MSSLCQPCWTWKKLQRSLQLYNRPRVRCREMNHCLLKVQWAESVTDAFTSNPGWKACFCLWIKKCIITLNKIRHLCWKDGLCLWLYWLMKGKLKERIFMHWYIILAGWVGWKISLIQQQNVFSSGSILDLHLVLTLLCLWLFHFYWGPTTYQVLCAGL